MSGVQLIKSPWEEQFYKVVEAARSDLLIASPFIKQAQATSVISRLAGIGVSTTIKVNIITDLKPDNMLTGSLDVDALLAFIDSLPNSTVTYLPNLHAKVYVADEHTAIITSANLTGGGLTKNFEYGAMINDPLTVASVRQDLRQYASLGAFVSRRMLESLANTAADLKELRQQAERSARQRFQVAFNQKLAAAKDELLSVRAEGKTTHRIFAETILYLLERGPLRTVDLHPLIQQLHPDLCDNNEDRIIKGVHFGKKWKHYVRTAQVYLRRRGLIYLDGTYWQKAHSSADV
jgi:hypothetical protein